MCISGLAHQPPEAAEAAGGEFTAGLKLVSAPPPAPLPTKNQLPRVPPHQLPPPPTKNQLPRVTGAGAANGPGACVTKAHWPTGLHCFQASVWSPGPAGRAAAFLSLREPSTPAHSWTRQSPGLVGCLLWGHRLPVRWGQLPCPTHKPSLAEARKDRGGGWQAAQLEGRMASQEGLPSPLSPQQCPGA